MNVNITGTGLPSCQSGSSGPGNSAAASTASLPTGSCSHGVGDSFTADGSANSLCWGATIHAVNSGGSVSDTFSQNIAFGGLGTAICPTPPGVLACSAGSTISYAAGSSLSGGLYFALDGTYDFSGGRPNEIEPDTTVIFNSTTVLHDISSDILCGPGIASCLTNSDSRPIARTLIAPFTFIVGQSYSLTEGFILVVTCPGGTCDGNFGGSHADQHTNNRPNFGSDRKRDHCHRRRRHRLSRKCCCRRARAAKLVVAGHRDWSGSWLVGGGTETVRSSLTIQTNKIARMLSVRLLDDKVCYRLQPRWDQPYLAHNAHRVLLPDQVSNMSHSSPSTQRSAESLPLIIPQSKSSQGPSFSKPYFFSTLAAALSAPSQTSRWMGRRR